MQKIGKQKENYDAVCGCDDVRSLVYKGLKRIIDW